MKRKYYFNNLSVVQFNRVTAATRNNICSHVTTTNTIHIQFQKGESPDKEADIPVTKQESIFVKKQSLEELASNVCCPECFEMMKCVFTRKHADSSFRIVCTKCAYVAKDNVHDHKTNEKGMYEKTLMIIYAVMLLGYRYSGVEKLCSLLSMNHISYPVYCSYASAVTTCAVEEAKSLLEMSRKAVVQY